MSSVLNHSHPTVGESILEQWHTIVELLAKFMDVPVALIMHLDDDDRLSVQVKNDSALNPYQLGHAEKCTGSGLYCEHVIRNNDQLFVNNALEDPVWQHNPDVALNMINYLGYPVHWPNGDIYGTLCVLDSKSHVYTDNQHKLLLQFRDMLESTLELLEKNKALNDLAGRYQFLANTDELTGILNRRAFISESDKELERAKRKHHQLSLLMMDLDDFKDINDHFGHNVGDQVLRQFADCVKASKRAYDIFGRLGGEEFALLLPETGRQMAMELAERIRKKVAGIFYHTQGKQVSITVSIGVCQLSGQESSILSSLSRADKLLYMAKHAGKNQVSTG